MDYHKDKNGTKFFPGDADAWRQILEDIIPMLYGIFIKRWHNSSLAEELVQKTIFDAIKGKDTFDPEKASPQQWITGIAANNTRLEIRRRATRPSIDGQLIDYIEKIDDELLHNEILEQRETAELVRAAMNRLQSNQRQVLTAKYIEDLSAKQIALKLRTTEKAVHSLLYRARNSLRKELKSLAPLKKQGQK